MSSGKTYARFLVPVRKPEGGKAKFITEEFTLQYADFDEKTVMRLREEMACYEIYVGNSYTYEYDDDDGPTHGYSSKSVPIEKMVSLSSGLYSTSDPRGDCLILGGHFAGVVIYVEERGGNGWSNYDRSGYTVLYTDGRIVGNNVSSYSFYGESSSKEDEYTYTLCEVTKE